MNGVLQFDALNVMVLVAALNCPACAALAADSTSPAIDGLKATDTTSPAAGGWLSATV